MTCFLYLRTIFIGIAQASLERVLNSLPEGLMVAFLAWLLLRIVGRRNAGTRFAVWFIALITVAAMPLFAGIQILLSKNAAFSGTPSGHLHLSLPLFWSVPIFALWASGVCLACARLMAGLYQVRSIRKSCVAISLEELNAVLRECVQDVFKQSKVSASITLAESDRVRVPSAMGFLRPMIVFPSGSLGSFAPDELAAVLTHELAHVRRRDAWTNLLQKVIRAIFFFHPAVWWIDARLTLEREMACDDAVLAHMGDPQTYAHCLIEL
jgi:beta-lactamase regulating signal transducer with metallopeptidase domain